VRAPAVVVAVPLLAGSACGLFVADGSETDIPRLCAAGALLALIGAIGAVLHDDRPEATIILAVGAALGGVSVGADAARRAYAPPLLGWYERTKPAEPVVVEGVLREDAAPVPSGASLTLDVRTLSRLDGGAPWTGRSRAPVLAGVRLSITGAFGGARLDEWRAGRTVRMPALLRRPPTYLNPGTPDERPALARRGIALVGTVKSAALVEVIRHGSRIDEAAAAVRAWARRRIAAQMPPRHGRSAGITTAVLIGDRSGLSADDERRLQEAGTYHVIAISGGNIAVLAVLTLAVCRLASVPGRAAAILAVPMLLFYGVIAAGAASVARAVTVAVLVLTARALDHRGPPINALAVASLAGVAAAPVSVLDAGFILSFGATLGIVLGMSRFSPWTSTAGGDGGAVHRAFRAAVLAIATLGVATFWAELALVPAGATLFGRVSFAGLVLNFIAIPLMTVVQLAGLAMLITGSVSASAGAAAGWCAHVAATGLLRSSELVELAPWLAARVPPPRWWLVALYYAAAGFLILAPRARRWAGAVVAASAAVLLLGPRGSSRDAVPAPAMPLRVVVLDVGQGDATVILLPDGRAILVDAGGLAAFGAPDPVQASAAFDIGERVVFPALRALGVKRLHAFAITHGDPDHLQGARGLLRDLGAVSVWEGVPVPPHQGLQALTSWAGTRRMSWRTVQAGDVERFGGAEIRVLHPPLPEWERQRVRNEDSIVLEVRLGQVSIVLPGDIGREGEQVVAPRLEPGRLVILKAPHHGSATSSTPAFLAALRPAAVIFSCGRDNRFGHPHPAVVARYVALGADIFSTAEDGAVFVDTDGTRVEVRGWVGRKAKFEATARR